MLVGASRQKVNAALMLLEEAGAVTRAGARITCHCEVLREIAQLE
jgi:DNA-binding GntR family transcriptional regulator